MEKELFEAVSLLEAEGIGELPRLFIRIRGGLFGKFTARLRSPTIPLRHTTERFGRHTIANNGIIRQRYESLRDVF